MKKAVIYYSGTGNTQAMAEKIASVAGAELIAFDEFTPAKAADYDVLARAGKLEEVRTVVAPDWMNPEETVDAVCRRLVSLGAQDVRYKIIRYRPMGVRSEYRGQSVPAAERLIALEKRANALGIRNTVRI